MTPPQYEQHLEAMQRTRVHDYRVYMIVREKGPLSTRQIFDKARCSKNTVGRVLARLCNMGMVGRKILPGHSMREVVYFATGDT